MTIHFIYLDCQKCKERIHCDFCENHLGEALMRIRGIRSAEIQMATKCLSIDTDLDMDTLEEDLEDIGIFIQ